MGSTETSEDVSTDFGMNGGTSLHTRKGQASRSAKHNDRDGQRAVGSDRRHAECVRKVSFGGSATITSNFAGRVRKTCARAATERSRLTQRGFPREGVIGLQSKEQKFSATLVPLVTRRGHSLQQHSISKLMIERSLWGSCLGKTPRN